MAAHQSRHFLLSFHLWLPLIILAVGTYLFRISKLDLAIQSRYYLGNGEWAFNNLPLARLIYHYGNLPALLLSLGALLLFIFSFSKPKALPYRKIGLYLVLAMVVGPGLIANSLLKDNWGRPRPREIIQFGGEYRYEAPLSIDPESSGKSFPCGHATMGFYFFSLGFVFGGKRKLLAYLCMIFALIWGSVIGFVRIGMGGHFASDVLWAAGVVYLASFGLFRIMGMHRQLYYQVEGNRVRKPLKLYQKLLLGLLGVFIVLGVLLATPYSAKKSFPIDSKLTVSDSINIVLKLEIADLTVSGSSQTQFSYRNNGFGFPGSKLKTTHEYLPSQFNLTQWKKGFFTELNCNAELKIEPSKLKAMHITLEKGVVKFPDGLLDTLYVDPQTVLKAETKLTKVIKADKPETAFWVKAPNLIFSQ